MLRLEPHDRVVVLGVTGAGKGHWCKEQLAQWMKSFDFVGWYDPMDEYSIHGLQVPGRKLGPLTQRCTADELDKDPERYLYAPERVALAVVPSSEDDEEIAADFVAFAVAMRHAALARQKARSLLGADEVGDYEEYCRKMLRRVGTQYRHWGIAVVLVAQRAVFIPLAARSQASHIISFRQDEDQDLEALYRRTRRTDEGFSDRVAQLPLYKFEHWRRKEAA